MSRTVVFYDDGWSGGSLQVFAPLLCELKFICNESYHSLI
uniref:Uncharacterized protein n=1 Tax=Rhizophora mucronata TaxID=61149 RepID=A0A2P2N6V0_RHIMU